MLIKRFQLLSSSGPSRENLKTVIYPEMICHDKSAHTDSREDDRDGVHLYLWHLKEMFSQMTGLTEQQKKTGWLVH